MCKHVSLAFAFRANKKDLREILTEIFFILQLMIFLFIFLSNHAINSTKTLLHHNKPESCYHILPLLRRYIPDAPIFHPFHDKYGGGSQ